MGVSHDFGRIMKAGWGWIVLGTVIGIVVALVLVLLVVFLTRFIRGTQPLLACRVLQLVTSWLCARAWSTRAHARTQAGSRPSKQACTQQVSDRLPVGQHTSGSSPTALLARPFGPSR